MLVRQDQQRDSKRSRNGLSRIDLLSSVPAVSVPVVRQLAGAEWVQGGDVHLVSRDAPDGRVYCRLAAATEAEVGRAAETAQLAFQRWRRAPSLARSRALVRVSEALVARTGEIANDIVRETGKPVAQAEGEVARAADVLFHYAAIAANESGRALTRYTPRATGLELFEPIGPAAVLTSWNMPIQLLAIKAGAALAAGCTVVIKSALQAPLAAVHFVKAILEAGIEPGCAQLVHGDASVAIALLRRSEIRIVSITGRDASGEGVMRLAANDLKPLVLELGGKSANIVFPDADLDRAAAGAVAGIARNQGAACTAGSRILAHSDIFTELRARICDRLRELVVGDPYERVTEMGALRSRDAYDLMRKTLNGALERGGCVYGGESISVPGRSGAYVRPALIEGLSPNDRINRSELFVPVATITPFRHEEEAIALANDSRYGLAAGVWSSDSQLLQRMWESLDVGVVFVNSYHRVDGLPYRTAGRKRSGFGSEVGIDGVQEFLVPKSVQLGSQLT
jgi:acyl-CoA reductase-like NAD-dependent aldehyde dehydrogenase